MVHLVRLIIWDQQILIPFVRGKRSGSILLEIYRIGAPLTQQDRGDEHRAWLEDALLSLLFESSYDR